MADSLRQVIARAHYEKNWGSSGIPFDGASGGVLTACFLEAGTAVNALRAEYGDFAVTWEGDEAKVWGLQNVTDMAWRGSTQIAQTYRLVERSEDD